ncbi:hypothetical protein J2W97_000804 [Paenibacillus jamilae]|jgi:hypothetical protein|uniref:hypothetical protein n=1 Tax=Paenibacillus polymyxa TaxID=1406 RepID=UPI001580A89D|nr:hypothetical protein [Paenibacillus polymyxa]MDP9674821.1 hypothetical protein [Paenibacillus jamilae]MBY0023809.1 hypothetical protein [Paenibacillus polymyxa]MBY0056481.1 hypothetical protein [Paenibacillus polymyxa]MBY0071828.1 hypothetical protein [Paenibacillus polymyxa]MBY0080606.1 hypothetical protein [Paenibacillus polymyxa]
MSNVNKPVIPAEVADAIEELRGKGESNRGVLLRRERIGNLYYTALVSISYDTLMAALINGYERELTDEQRKHDALREAYFDLLGTEFASGINYALTTLGINVSGVNAE